MDNEHEENTPRLWAERTGVRRYRAFNKRGAQVEVGDPSFDECFSPGELMKLAVATCAGLSADARLTHALGEDIDVKVIADGDYDEDNDRYTRLSAELIADLSSLSDDDRQTLQRRVASAIARACTVGRTVVNSAEYDYELTSQPPAQEA